MLCTVHVRTCIVLLQVGSREETDSAFSSDDVYPVNPHFLTYLSNGYIEPNPRYILCDVYMYIHVYLHANTHAHAHVHLHVHMYPHILFMYMYIHIVTPNIYCS